MKRKLISFDAFSKLQESSLSNIEDELIHAEDLLGKTLGTDVELVCFGEDDATYKTSDGTFIHAVYKMDDNQIILENIEELVIEEEGAKKVARNILSNMVDALLENNDSKANELLTNYFEMPTVRKEITNEAFKITISKPTGKRSKLAHKRQSPSLVAKRIRSRMKTLKRQSPSVKAELARKRKIAKNKLGHSTNARWRVYARKVKTNEWTNLCENVYGYIDYKNFGPVLKESAVRTDNKGNIVALAIPTQQKRNEGKILSFNWKTLDHEVKVLRGNAKNINEDQVFVKAIVDLKRYNNISDNTALEETLEAIVSRWPNLLYLTQDELSTKVSEALEMANVTNYDDQSCQFMAEAILRTAHHAYTDKVRKISNVAGISQDLTSDCKDCKDSYLEFKTVVDQFYSKLDESDNNDLKVFADLYKALNEVHKLAIENNDEVTKIETADLMSDCEAILNKESAPDLNLAESIANYISSILEANLPGSEEEMDVVDKPYETINGDNPRTAWNAKQDAYPSNYTGDWGDPAPVSDGKSYKNGLADEMRNNSWGNSGGNEVWPNLNNPHTPEPFGDYTMKGEPGADKNDEDWSRWQSNDTWPNLENPYLPKAADVFTAKTDNLIVNK